MCVLVYVCVFVCVVETLPSGDVSAFNDVFVYQKEKMLKKGNPLI